MNELPPMPSCPKCGALDVSTDSRRWFCECGWSEPIATVAGEPRKQSMLYEICPHCEGKGPHELAKVPCCKRLGVVETGATAGQLAYIAELDLLRQEAGISAAMLRDGRARAYMEAGVRAKSVAAPDDDPPVCRLQFPDGTVPGNAREAAEGWKAWADKRHELVKLTMELLANERAEWCAMFGAKHPPGKPLSPKGARLLKAIFTEPTDG